MYSNDPKPGWVTTWELQHGHVAMLHLYGCSMSADKCPDITDSDVIAYAPSATLPTEGLRTCW